MEVGNIVLSAISDGTFVARPGYFGDDAAAEGHGEGSAAMPATRACGRSTGTPRSRRASRQFRRRGTRLATSASWSPPRANGHSSSVTRSPARCSWTSRPGTPSATSIRISPTVPASISGVSSKARTSPARVRTSQSSSSDACSRATGSAGGRDAPTAARPKREPAALANSRVSLGGARRTASRGSPRSHTAQPAHRARRPAWPPPRRGHLAEPAARCPSTRRRRQPARDHAG
jgi:hypothetical protein